MGEEDEEDLERLRALLDAQHEFPGAYTFKVIYRNQPALGESIVEAICGGVGLEPPDNQPGLRASSGAKFVSMTLDLRVRTSQDVLDVYGVLRRMESVISYF